MLIGESEVISQEFPHGLARKSQLIQFPLRVIVAGGKTIDHVRSRFCGVLCLFDLVVLNEQRGIFLARRPFEGSATKQVNMQVGNGFSTIRTIVDDETVARFVNSFLFGNRSSGQQEMT